MHCAGLLEHKLWLLSEWNIQGPVNVDDEEINVTCEFAARAAWIHVAAS